MGRRRIAGTGALAFLLAASAASAQELGPGPRGHERVEFLPGLALHGRFIVPFGSADREISAIAGGGGAVVVVDEHLSWADLFRPGWGAELELDLFTGRSRDSVFGPEASFRYGAFAAAGLERYEGDRAGDGAGAAMDLEDLDLATFTLGGKIATSLGDGQRVEGRVGLGVVHTSEVDAVFSGGGAPAFRTEFLRDTWAPAIEFRGHWGVEFGPLALVLGLGFRAAVPPGEGDAVDLSPGAFFTFDVDVGIELGF